ncbi:MAG: pantoate--beta-alanine ligase [Planctomycetes bacterium]|nr:pantoate--beta-alanine ligase [Planctomycetota bacterium]
MHVVRTGQELADLARELTGSNRLGGVLVPTMGALHEAHLALIRRAREVARRNDDPAGCVVSIFVNPAQFNERDDFERYPRPLEDDLATCERDGVCVVFAPAPDVVYPPDEPSPDFELPPIVTQPRLEDTARPGHFRGVNRVLHRLFELIAPRAAVFGEKDYQQLILARHVGRLKGVDVLGHPTVRAPDGLALSSRNVFLKGPLRQQALALSRSLIAASREPTPERAERAMNHVLREAGLTPDYAAVRDAQTLTRQGPGVEQYRAVVAARVGVVRLLDNAPWPGWTMPT